jgi:hypothetical protein
MSDLSTVYQQLARPWTHDQLADHYRAALLGAERDPSALPSRAVAVLASAIPCCATLSVAIHVLHMLPATSDPGLVEQLLDTVEDNSALVLYRCHRALELDGRAHDYTAEEWLPAIHDIAAPLLEAARLDREPPSFVEHAQDAVNWLSRAIIELDAGGHDAPGAIADSAGRVLALQIFAAMPHRDPAGPDE